MFWICLTFISLAAVLSAEHFGHKQAEWFLKPLASIGFIGFAWSQGALESAPGIAVFTALVLSWWGDVFLIAPHPKAFLLGLVAFLLAHVAYIWAFVEWGIDPIYAAIALVPVAGVSAIICRWLLPQTPKEMRIPVLAYVAVISAMVALAAGLLPLENGWKVLGAALLFFCSDLSVAINRFVSKSFIHRLWGLPLYYAAQLCFAALSS